MRFKCFSLLCALLFLLPLLAGCGGKTPAEGSPTPNGGGDALPVDTPETTPSPTPLPLRDTQGMTLSARYAPPQGFTRTEAAGDSFAAWLRELPLKADGTQVTLRDGNTRLDARPDSVIDLSGSGQMEKTDLALLLHASYLYDQERYADMAYHFYSGFPFSFDKWSEGLRIKQNDKGGVDWVETAAPDASETVFSEFLLRLHMYANPLALVKDISARNAAEPGLLLMRDRADGKGWDNGLLIVDMAVDAQGQVALILAACGTPAQDGYIAENTAEPALSPWYIVPDSGLLDTPEGIYSLSNMFGFS